MESKINIVTVVDVVEALSSKTLLEGNLCMMDDSPFESHNQGTPNLCTHCLPGQVIKWSMIALDLQTPVAIKSIRFIGPDGADALPKTDPLTAESDKLHLNVWEGIVPYDLVPGVEYKYRMEVQMYEGINCLMTIDSPSIKRIY